MQRTIVRDRLHDPLGRFNSSTFNWASRKIARAEERSGRQRNAKTREERRKGRISADKGNERGRDEKKGEDETAERWEEHRIIEDWTNETPPALSASNLHPRVNSPAREPGTTREEKSRRVALITQSDKERERERKQQSRREPEREKTDPSTMARALASS